MEYVTPETKLSKESRMYLSPPDTSQLEVEAITNIILKHGIGPSGENISIFEQEIAQYCHSKFGVALSSGTSALHLGLLALGVKAGDEVVVPTLTFGATAFAVDYIGAKPIFLDVENQSWNLDPELLEKFLQERSKSGNLPKVIITVDLFGRVCNYDSILNIAKHYEIPILADAAEALGAQYKGSNSGNFGEVNVLSFNGNKIITTSGGGMILTENLEIANKIRYWSNQSREQLPWYEHNEIGYNYRMSNLLATLGRAQLSRLPELIKRRRRNRDLYLQALGSVSGLSVQLDPPWGNSNAWLTTITLDSKLFPGAPKRIREKLELSNIESRPVWKPLHLQPVYKSAKKYLSGYADQIYSEGLCLPSGSTMSDEDVQRVSNLILSSIKNVQ
jgi:dTDP-4-amino-4,6-dideoxygalactose transaminase